MRTCLTAAFACLALMATAFQPLAAQSVPNKPPSPASDIVDRFYKARAVISAAVKAAGGAEAIRAVSGLSYELEGDVFNDIQGYSASRIGHPEKDSRQRILNRIDWAGSRFSQTVEQRAESGFDSKFGTIWAGGTSYSPRWIPRDYAQTDNSPSPFQPGAAVMVSSRWLPPVILKRALQNQRSAYWVTAGELGGEAVDVVDVSFDEVTRFRLHVVKASGLIRRVETMAPDPVSADDATVADLSGDQVVGGVHFPTGIRAARRGFVNQDFAMTAIAVNPPFAPADFAAPTGFVRQSGIPAQPRADRVAGRVFEVSGLAGGSYQAPFVVMDDFVVAFEAPLGIAASRQMIAEIRKVAGDKPIRYVVVSHFHADHAGGIGAFVEAGAIVLSSEANRAILTTYARANRSQVQGLEGVRADLAVPFEAVAPTGRTIVDRTGSKLEILDFPRNGHVEHMLALFDPQSRALMVADHYIEAVAWNPAFQQTANWVRKNRKVDTLLGTHIRPITRSAFLAHAAEPHNDLK